MVDLLLLYRYYTQAFVLFITCCLIYSSSAMNWKTAESNKKHNFASKSSSDGMTISLTISDFSSDGILNAARGPGEHCKLP